MEVPAKVHWYLIMRSVCNLNESIHNTMLQDICATPVLSSELLETDSTWPHTTFSLVVYIDHVVPNNVNDQVEVNPFRVLMSQVCETQY